MPKLIIGNGFNEAMVGDTTKSSFFFRQGVASEAKRLGWVVDKDDVLILPAPLSQPMIEYIAKTLERDISSATFISVSPDSKNPLVLTSEILLNSKLIEDLEILIADGNAWQIFPYFFTSSVVQLAQTLNIPLSTKNAPSFISQSGADLLNSKAIFRAMAAGYGIPIPPGSVCRTPVELYYATRELMKNIKTIIIKQNINASGDGNIAVTLENRPGYPGVREVIRLNNIQEITLDFVNKIWHILTDPFGNNQLIVEAYFSTTHTLYAEYNIFDNAQDHQRISYGIVRMDSSGDKRGKGMINWVGFQIPFTISPPASESFLLHCDILVKAVASLGYTGRINLDAILTEEGKIYFTEINGRLGGCSHLHFIAKKLIGPHYLTSHYLLTRNRVQISNLNAAFKTASSFSSSSHISGAVILNEDMATMGTIEYMVYAKSISEAMSIEQEFGELLKNDRAELSCSVEDVIA